MKLCNFEILWINLCVNWDHHLLGNVISFKMAEFDINQTSDAAFTGKIVCKNILSTWYNAWNSLFHCFKWIITGQQPNFFLLRLCLFTNFGPLDSNLASVFTCLIKFLFYRYLEKITFFTIRSCAKKSKILNKHANSWKIYEINVFFYVVFENNKRKFVS